MKLLKPDESLSLLALASVFELTWRAVVIRNLDHAIDHATVTTILVTHHRVASAIATSHRATGITGAEQGADIEFGLRHLRG